MFAKQIVLVLGAVMLLTVSVFGQGEFLRDGESGFGVALDFPISDEAFDIGYNFGYSARCIMDVGLSYVEFDELDAKAYAPYITVHFVTPTPDQPLGTAFTAAYEWVSLDDGRSSQSEGIYVLGLSLFANLLPPGTVLVQPAISGGVAINSDASDDDIDLIASAGMAICFNRNCTFRPVGYISHTTTGDESQTVFGVGLVTAW